LTQNVDGFHRQAGSTNVIDIHGDVHDLACTSCPYRNTVEDYSGLEETPGCPECHSVLRPAVILFGEMLPQAKVLRLGAELERGFDAVFSVGTTSVFPYIAQPVVDARMRGIPTVEINPGNTEVSDVVDLKLDARAAEACPAIWLRAQGLAAE
jgi:NAD-dependent deacetylase